MNTIKYALKKGLLKYEDRDVQRSLGIMLFEKVLEKRRRREERIKLCFQCAVFVLLSAFLFFAYLFSLTAVIRVPQAIMNALLTIVFIIFMDICSKVLGFIPRRKLNR